MLFRYSLLSIFLYNIDCLFNIFSRSDSIKFKERCGQSVLLNNNYWLLKQTYDVLKILQQNQDMSFEILPWNRLKNSIEQIYQNCLIDDMKYSKERMYIHQTAVKAGTLLAKKVKDISHPTLIELQ